MDVIETLLYSATQEALASMGEPMRRAFISHVQQEGVRYSQMHIDFDQIHSKLRQFFGSCGNVITYRIYENFVNKAMAEGYFGEDVISMLDMLPKNPDLAKLHDLITRERKTPS